MTQATLVDSHCHLDFPELADDLDGVIARAHAAGVTRMVTICTKLRNEPQVRAIAEAHPSIFYAAGTHPMSVADEPMASLDDLITLTHHPKMIGIGETGLDYHYTSDSAEAQKSSLRTHITASQHTGLPLIIHARAADDDMAQILTSEFKNAPYTCVMHCFSSSPKLARAALDLDFYLSMSGITAFPKSQDLRDIFAAAPHDRILVETDSPYLAPPPHRGKRNEPAFTAHTATRAAETLGLSLTDFATQTTKNFDRLFPKAANWAAT